MFRTVISLLLMVPVAVSAEHRTENVVLVTRGGVRVEEIFTGMDPVPRQ